MMQILLPPADSYEWKNNGIFYDSDLPSIFEIKVIFIIVNSGWQIPGGIPYKSPLCPLRQRSGKDL
jgi:hypothetical protein